MVMIGRHLVGGGEGFIKILILIIIANNNPPHHNHNRNHDHDRTTSGWRWGGSEAAFLAVATTTLIAGANVSQLLS